MTWTWGPEQERQHPRDAEGQWARKLSARLPGGSIFDSFTDPEFGDPTPQQQEQAERWAHDRFDYVDRTTGYRSQVFSVEHNADGFTVAASFQDGEHSIGGYQFGITQDEEGHKIGFVEEINIDSDRRGEGLAKRWVHRLEQALKAEGVEFISMWDMSGGFWEHMGYTRDRQGVAGKTL